ncbi:hypothetical protein ABFP60_01845 [Clostridioides difficile]
MKKFNIDELIWFIILVFLTLSIVFLIRSGNITNFVSVDMIKYFYLSIGILSVFAIFQFSRIFTIRRRVEVTNKFLPLTFTLCVGVVLLYLFPLLKNNDNIDNEILFNNNDAIIITNNNYGILSEINENRNAYEGKSIVFLGYVDENKSNSEFTIISRESIKCCQADKEKVQVRAKGIASNIKEGQWINICGKICFDESFYILIDDYKIQNEPKDIYFHESL